MMIKKAVSAFNRYGIFLLLYTLILVFCLLPYYRNGCLVLGGEGDYVINFTNHLKKFSFMWFSDYGLGMPNLSPSGVGINILLLSLIERLFNAQAANFILIFSIYFFPFLAFHLIAREVKSPPFLSFAIPFFYVFNPFMSIYLESFNQWNVFSAVAMPLFFWVILKNYHNAFKLFFHFGLLSLMLSFANTNYPMMVVIQISLIFSLIFVCIYYNFKFNFKEFFVKYLLILFSFLLFNSWWLLNVSTAFTFAAKIYTKTFASGWLQTVAHNSGPLVFKIFTLAFGFSDDPKYSFFSFWYSLGLVKFITIIPIFTLIYLIFFYKPEMRRALFFKGLFLFLLILIFFVKGSAAPFGFIYNLIFSFVPFFYIFKSPIEKFGLLYEFVFMLLLLFVILEVRGHKIYRWIQLLFVFYLLCCCIPLITGNIFSDYRLNTIGYASRMYQDKAEYVQLRQLISNDPLEYRLLSLPGGGNYQVCLKNYGGKYYTGMDPLLTNTPKAYISLEHNIRLLYEEIADPEYNKLLGLYNIKKMVINEDLIPWFGNVGPGDTEVLIGIFNDRWAHMDIGTLKLYDNKDNFLPRIYIVGSGNGND